MLVKDVMDTLAQYPPPQPTRPAVNLLVAVGKQQEYLARNNLLPPPGNPGALDALQVDPSLTCPAHMMAAMASTGIAFTVWLSGRCEAGKHHSLCMQIASQIAHCLAGVWAACHAVDQCLASRPMPQMQAD
jgi:hypothetical protein